VQAALLGLVLLHGVLGLRSMLLDFGLPARWQRFMLLLALLCGGSAFTLFWLWRWY
jgi:succinate dehydrogenase/fumarate reductase cytochrome b subunit